MYCLNREDLGRAPKLIPPQLSIGLSFGVYFKLDLTIDYADYLIKPKIYPN